MDTAIPVLRIIHVIFGIFVAGTYLFMVPILEPGLRRLGPSIQNPVMGALMPVMTPVMATSIVILLSTGVAMTLILRWGSLGSLFVTGWGWAMIIGLVATIGAAVVGFGIITPTGIRLSKMGKSIQGRPPTPEEGQQLHRLSSRIETLSRLNFIFIVLATAAMISSRYL